MAKRGKRAGVVKPPSKGLRTCVGCVEKHAPEHLIRVVAGPDKAIYVDRYQKAPGRGAYVCYEATCFEQAVRNRGFERALKCSGLRVEPSELARQVVETIDMKLENALSIARVSKRTVSGMDSISRSLDRLKGFVLASDVAKATSDRIRKWGKSRALPVVEYGTAQVLGRTQGKPDRVAIGVLEAKTLALIVAEVERRNRVLVAACGGKP